MCMIEMLSRLQGLRVHACVFEQEAQWLGGRPRDHANPHGERQRVKDGQVGA